MSATDLIHLPEVRRRLGVDSNRSVRAACSRFGIPVIDLNRKVKGVRECDYALLLARASGKETV